MTFVLLSALLAALVVGSSKCTQYVRVVKAPMIVERAAAAVGLVGIMSMTAGLVTFDAATETGLGLVALGVLGVGLQIGTVSIVWIAATVFDRPASKGRASGGVETASRSPTTGRFR